MPTTSWNDAEDEALRKLPWRARVVYLQGVRRYMDYQTGWAGKQRVLSYRFFIELLEATEHTTDPDPAVTKDGLRAIFRMLERVGLVEWPRGTSNQRGVFFRCLLASTDNSVQKQDAPKTHPRRTHQDAPPPVSGIREEITTTAVLEREAKNARGARLSLTHLPDDWRDWSRQQRPDLDPDTTWQMFRDHWQATPGAKGCKADWQATWRNWVRREHASPGGHHGNPYESTFDRRARINRAFIDAGQRAFDEMGSGPAGALRGDLAESLGG